MRRNITLTAGVVVLLIGSLMMASIAEAKPFKRSFSGWQVATEIDTNGDGVTEQSGTNMGMGTFGPATSNGQSEIAPIPSGICDGNPAILKFDFLAYTLVQIYRNGDGLAMALDHGTVCYNTLLSAWVFEIQTVILGGTGRFEGATGSVTVSGEGIGLAGDGVRWTHSAMGGTMEGEIFLAP